MKRTPLLGPRPDGSKSLRITYRRFAPTQSEGKLNDVVIDTSNGNRYVKTSRGWEDADFSPLREFIDDTTLRDAGVVATGEFRERAIMSVYEKLSKSMRFTGTRSCHYEDGDIVYGWAK